MVWPERASLGTGTDATYIIMLKWSCFGIEDTHAHNVILCHTHCYLEGRFQWECV